MTRKGIAVLAFLLLFPWSVRGQSHDIDHINAAIHAKGHKWVAGETSLSALSDEEKRMRVRLVKPTGTEAPHLATIDGPVSLGTTLDWRDYNLNNYVTPVRNQGSCGSCWAFATTAALEAATNIKQNTPGYDLNLAEQILVSCSGAGSCNGGTVSGSSNYIRDTGLPWESAYPYTATNGTCSSALANWQASAFRITSWSYVATSSPTVDGIKNALATYGPLVTTMAVYNDFFSYRTGVYAYATGSLAGYHAVLIVGYDDAAQAFIVKNSWGTGWGEAGFFRIAYTELNSVTQFGDYTIAYVVGTPPSPPPPPPTPTCTYSITPTSASFGAAGGSGSITVTAGSGCAWTATTSQPSWVTITTGASGSGSGSVTYTVGSATANRTATITVAGQTFSIQQKVANPRRKK